MSVHVDPRLAARRRQVREGWARRRLRWIVGLVTLVLIAGIGIALFQSPWLAVRTVSVFGVAQAPVAEVLEAHDLVAGVPTVSVRPAVVEEALLANPWVARAEVRVTWPGAVEVTILEREPSAWIELDAGWAQVASDGVVLEVGQPDDDAPRVTALVGSAGPGDRIEDAGVVGAIEFLGLLPSRFAVGASATVTALGIEARVAGHDVLLGNERDIPEKVATLTALLESPLEPEATLNIISPVRPSVTNPQPLVEDTEEDVSSSDDSG
jgi:cell division protein FtsQ